MSSTSFVPSTTTDVVITGSNLVGATVVVNGSDDVTATIVSSANLALTIRLTVAANAAFGSRTLEIRTAAGTFRQTIAIMDGGRWIRTGRMVEGRLDHTATLLPDGRVLVAGGRTNETSILRTAELYDSVSNTWTSTGSMALARVGHAAVLLPDGRVLVAGGRDSSNAISSAEIYDAATGRWSSVGFMSRTALELHGLLLADGRIFISAAGQIYDPAKNTFEETAVFPGSTSARFTDSTIIINGFLPDRPNTPVYGTLIYDPQANTYRQITLLVQASGSRNSITLLPDGSVYGRSDYISPKPFTTVSVSAGRYDAVRDIRTEANPGNIGGTPVLLSDGRVFLPGQMIRASNNARIAGTGAVIYDPITNLLHPAAPMISARDGGEATLLNDGRVLVTGNARAGSPAIDDSGNYPEIFVPPVSTIVSPAVSTVSLGVSSITVAGSNFLPNTVVALNGRRLVSIYMGSSKLIAFIPEALRPNFDTRSIVVTNPGAAASVSVPSGPIVTNVVPNTISAGSTATIALTGTGLGNVTAAAISGDGVTTQLLENGSSTTLRFDLTVSSNATAGPRTINLVSSGLTYSFENVLTIRAPVLPVPETVPLPIPVVEQGNVTSGYVVITPQTGGAPFAGLTLGIVRNGSVLSQAGVLPGSLMTDAAVYIDTLFAGGRDVALAILNPSSTANDIRLTLRNESGATVATISRTLNGHQQIARFVGELFSRDTLGAAFRGSVRIESGTPFIVIGFRFSGVEFAVVPVSGIPATTIIPTRVLGAGAAPDSPRTGTIGGSGSVAFPQFALSGGWASQISLVNNSSVTINGRVDLLDSNGNPLPANLNGQQRSTFTYSLAPGASLLIAPRDTNGQTPL